MKPKNFPARKNQRREDVLDRLLFNIDGATEQHKEEIVILSRKVIDQDEARAIRTKKYRGSK